MKTSKRFLVEVWIDGSCIGNPGPGGWAAVLVTDGKARLLGGHVAKATNNQMETRALREALATLKVPCEVVVFTDSQYVILGLQKVLLGKFPETNLDYWGAVHRVIGRHSILISKTDAHGDDRWNNLVDDVAYRCAKYGLDFNEFYDDSIELLNKARKR